MKLEIKKLTRTITSYSSTLLLLLAGTGCKNEQNSGDVHTPQELTAQQENQIIKGQLADLKNKNRVAIEIPFEKSEVFLEVSSRGELIPHYESTMSYHPFGRVFPAHTNIAPHVLNIGCNIHTKTFEKTVLDENARDVSETDIAFEVAGETIAAQVYQERPLILSLLIPASDEIGETTKRELIVINKTFKPVVKQSLDLGDCRAKGYPHNGFNIINKPTMEVSEFVQYQGKQMELTLLKEVP